MMNNEVAKAVATIPEEMESYAEIRMLVRSRQFDKALESVKRSPISQSTKQLELVDPFLCFLSSYISKKTNVKFILDFHV